MEIGVVVHGPGIIDSGWAVELIDYLSKKGDVRCRLGGTMGRTAVIDAALENIIDISLKLLPSESLEIFNREEVDVIFLLNYGKSQETGHVFGYKTFTHYFKKISNEDYLSTNHRSYYNSDIPVVQIERPGEEDGSIISWNVDINNKIKENKKIGGLFSRKKDDSEVPEGFIELFQDLVENYNLKNVFPEDVLSNYFSDLSNAADQETVDARLAEYNDLEANFAFRKVHGASPDENIFVNGIVVGTANSDNLILITRDNIIVDIIGGDIKGHGVEKLGPVDITRAILKTGLLRKAEDVKPRVLNSETLSIQDIERNLYSDGDGGQDSFKIAFVDHAAYDIYRFKDFDLVITIGDDTTLVASDILYRLDVPIIGITDGDLDKVVETGFVKDESIILEVASGFDDVVGNNIYERLFNSNQILEIENEGEYESVSEFKKAQSDIFLSRIIEIVQSIVPSFIQRRGNDIENQIITGYVNDSVEFVDDSVEFVDEFAEESVSQFDNVEEIYVEYEPSGDVFYEGDVEEIYVEHDSSDDVFYEGDVEEIYVEHEPSGDDFVEIEEIYVEHEPSGDDFYEGNVEEIYVEHEEIPDEPRMDNLIEEEIYMEEAPNEIYVQHVDVPNENNIDEFIDEVFLDEEVDSDEIYLNQSSDLDKVVIEPDSIPEEIFIEYEPSEETDYLYGAPVSDETYEKQLPKEVYVEEYPDEESQESDYDDVDNGDSSEMED